MGGSSSNKAAINEQKKAAAEARYKDDLRDWRLEKGINEINNLFDGTPLPALRPMPTYQTGSIFYEPTTLDTKPIPVLDRSFGTEMIRAMTGYDFAAAGPDARKNQYSITPNTKNWQDDLASTYLQAYNDYYVPQLEQQYEDANKNLTYDLARAGLLRSSAAADTQSDLARQNAENTAMVKSQGDQGVAALKQKINAAKQDAINQLYATENPDVAANQALSSIRTIQSTQPEYSPLGDIFRTAAVGIGGYQQGTADRRYNDIIMGGNRKAATTIPG